MTQVLPRYCPRCGAPIASNSPVCATCGLSLENLLTRDENKPVEAMKHDSENSPEFDVKIVYKEDEPEQEDELERVPTLHLDQQIEQHRITRSNTQSFSTKGEQSFSNFSPQKKRKMGRRELMILLVLLLLVLGAIVYAFAGLLGLALPGFVNIQPSISTTAIYTSIPYSGVNITILNVQRSQSFLNDPNSNSNGMVRLNLQERNPTNVSVVWSYGDIARLMMPNKPLISPAYVNSIVKVAPGATQKSVVDFAVPTTTPPTQLTFVLGAPNEAQMLIPLMRNVDVSKYQPKTTNLNAQMLYFGLNWTLTSATWSLSIQGQQASKGLRYVTLLLKVDNTLSQIAITGSPYEYMRLQYGNRSALPEHATIPVAFPVGATNVTGTVSFQVPQQTSSFTFILLSQKGDNGDQSSADIHLS